MSSKYDALTFNGHQVNGVYPVADAFNSSATTDFVNLANYGAVRFTIHTGNATGGTANGTVTLLASAVAAGSSTTALAFKYRVCASSTSVDTWGALTDATSSGFSMTTGDNYLYEVYLTADDLVSQIDGKPFVALKVTESSNDPIDAGVMIQLYDARYQGAIPVTAIA